MSRVIERIKESPTGSNKRSFKWIWAKLTERRNELKEDQNEQSIREALLGKTAKQEKATPAKPEQPTPRQQQSSPKKKGKANVKEKAKARRRTMAPRRRVTSLRRNPNPRESQKRSQRLRTLQKGQVLRQQFLASSLRRGLVTEAQVVLSRARRNSQDGQRRSHQQPWQKPLPR